MFLSANGLEKKKKKWVESQFCLIFFPTLLEPYPDVISSPLSTLELEETKRTMRSPANSEFLEETLDADKSPITEKFPYGTPLSDSHFVCHVGFPHDKVTYFVKSTCMWKIHGGQTRWSALNHPERTLGFSLNGECDRHAGKNIHRGQFSYKIFLNHS